MKRGEEEGFYDKQNMVPASSGQAQLETCAQRIRPSMWVITKLFDLHHQKPVVQDTGVLC
eukprot:1832366-Amphidinium_carterae.2